VDEAFPMGPPMDGPGFNALSPGSEGRRPGVAIPSLERGWRKDWLILQLARSSHTPTALARELGVAPSTVTRFAQRYAEQINQARQSLADRFADLWVAEKRARLGELAKDIEALADVGDRILALADDPRLTEAERLAAIINSDWREVLRLKNSFLRSVAEELGQIPNKTSVQLNQKVVTYAIEGVDVENDV